VVIVVHSDRVIAERYAPGIERDTPLDGHSLAKSFVNALVGVLVRQAVLLTEKAALTHTDQ
jgi:CubicO group peptidase (beta-lactamase class C family)